VVDVRLRNRSQLSGFAKSGDLGYFLDRLCEASYEREGRFTPTPELLLAYRKREIAWRDYESAFLELMEERDVPNAIDRAAYARAKTALLCSEAQPDLCHRRLIAELMSKEWGAHIEHL
jgi:hypothetical protein